MPEQIICIWSDLPIQCDMPKCKPLEQSDLLWTRIAGLRNASSSLARWQLRARVMYSGQDASRCHICTLSNLIGGQGRMHCHIVKRRSQI